LFATVGASGSSSTLAVFAACVHGVGIDYRAAACSRSGCRGQQLLVEPHWTVRRQHERPIFQAVRFFTVSLVAFGFT